MTGIQQVTWTFDNLERIGGHPVSVRGNPRVVPTDRGHAIQWDGRSDQLLVAGNPLRGAEAFTVEALFLPEAGVNAANDPRFLHFMDPADPQEKRLMMEIRVNAEGRWAFDAMLRTDAGEKALLDLSLQHPTGVWATAAVSYDGKTLATYVNGAAELRGDLAFRSELFGAGAIASVGARMNQVHFFAGVIRTLRFTAAALEPMDLLRIG